MALAVGLAAPLLAFAAGSGQFSAERFKAHVAFLADDQLEGREAGTRGHEIAARYVATQFQSMGMAPGGENGGWYQQVQLGETTLTGPPASLAITTPKGTQTFANGGAVVVRGLPSGGTLDLKADAVFVGYGVTDKARGLDDYRGLDVAGKVVVFFRASTPGADSEVSAHLRADQGRNAALHGALATIVISTRATSRLNPWRAVAADATLPTTGWVDPQGQVQSGAAALKASAVVDTEPAVSLFEGAEQSFDEVLTSMTTGKRPQGFP